MRFAHASEQAFAGLLDSYGIRWEYEPRMFVLERDDDGRTATGFTPDFYLPDFDMYVELTTLRQRLVTRKHRKLRLLGEVHPDIRVKLLYRRDVEWIGRKYGFALAS